MKKYLMDILTSLSYKSRALFRKIEVDRAVLLGILARLWSIVAMPISLLLIAHKFSGQLQGYYYTFLSIITFQFLIELGIGSMIVQFVSHEWSGLSLDKAGHIIGERNALSRLQSLAQIFSRWYCVASIILTLGLGLVGYLFLSRNQDANIDWMLPWFSLCVCNGVIFCLIPIWSLLEGCNQVSRLYAYRLVQSILLSLSLWTAILLDARLWTIVISNIVVIICAGTFLMSRYKVFLKTLLFSKPTGPCIKWHKEILPLQWRIAMAWLIGPISSSLFVPTLFKYHGSVVAGQMGMTWSIASVVLSIESAWISPKIPRFGMMIAKNKYEELDDLFWRTTKIAVAFAIAAAIIAWFVVYILNEIKHPLAARFLPVLPTGIFLLSQVILAIAWPFSTYLRAHKKEPFLFASIAAGISIGLATLILGRHYSAIGIAVGYLSINLISAPVAFIIWHRCRIEWHKDEYAESVISDNDMTTNRVI